MKTAVLLFPLLALICAAHALPVQQELETTEGEEREIAPLLQQTEEESIVEDKSVLSRERRSPGGWQGGRGGFPQPQPQPQQPRGSVSGGVHREKGVGTVVQAQGQGNVWSSKDGRTRVDAQGDWSKVVSGPQRGKPNYNVGATFSHHF